MAGTVELVEGSIVLFRFPYSQQANDALRDAVGNRVRWDAGLRGFALRADRLIRDPAMTARLSRFVADHELDADAGVRRLLAIRTVTAVSIPAPPPALRPAGPDDLGPGQLRCSLLPFTTWGSNLLGIFSREQWDALRIPVCTAAGNVCEVCAAAVHMDSGRPRRPDCHELWTFHHDGARRVQRLDRLIALCPDCHRAQHIGLAGINGESELVIAKLRAVNNWTRQQASQEMDRAEAAYVHREGHSWDLDLSALRSAVTVDGYPDLYFPYRDRGRLGNSYYLQAGQIRHRAASANPATAVAAAPKPAVTRPATAGPALNQASPASTAGSPEPARVTAPLPAAPVVSKTAAWSGRGHQSPSPNSSTIIDPGPRPRADVSDGKASWSTLCLCACSPGGETGSRKHRRASGTPLAAAGGGLCRAPRRAAGRGARRSPGPGPGPGRPARSRSARAGPRP
jgi:hypothetical protein